MLRYLMTWLRRFAAQEKGQQRTHQEAAAKSDRVEALETKQDEIAERLRLLLETQGMLPKLRHDYRRDHHGR